MSSTTVKFFNQDVDAIDEKIISAEDLINKIQNGNSLAAAANLTKNDLEAIYTMGYIRFNQGRYEDALKLFGLLIFYEQSDRRFFIAVGTCLQMLNMPEMAITYLGLANISEPSDPGPAVRVAECLLAMKRFDEAYSLLRKIRAEFGAIPEHSNTISRVDSLIMLGNNSSEKSD